MLSWNSTAGKNWQIIDSNFHFHLAEWIQSNFNQMLIISAERADHTWKKIANHWLFVSSIFIFFKCNYVTNIIWRHIREIMLQVIYLKLGCELSHHYHYSAINHYIIFISPLPLPFPSPQHLPFTSSCYSRPIQSCVLGSKLNFCMSTSDSALTSGHSMSCVMMNLSSVGRP